MEHRIDLKHFKGHGLAIFILPGGRIWGLGQRVRCGSNFSCQQEIRRFEQILSHNKPQLGLQ
jgi:hypothetical protein